MIKDLMLLPSRTYPSNRALRNMLGLAGVPFKWVHGIHLDEPKVVLTGPAVVVYVLVFRTGFPNDPVWSDNYQHVLGEKHTLSLNVNKDKTWKFLGKKFSAQVFWRKVT